MPSISTVTLLTLAATTAPALAAPFFQPIQSVPFASQHHPDPRPIAGKFEERNFLTSALDDLIGAGAGVKLSTVLKDAVLGGFAGGAAAEIFTPSPPKKDASKQTRAASPELKSIGKGAAGLVAGLIASTLAGQAVDDIKSLFQRQEDDSVFACLSLLSTRIQPTVPLLESPFNKCIREHGPVQKRLLSGPSFLDAIKEKFQEIFGRELSDEDATIVHQLLTRELALEELN